MSCHDNESWVDLREGETGLMCGRLENVSPAHTADCIVITFTDWSQMAFDVPEGEPVDVKHMEEQLVSVAFRRTEDGCEAYAIWTQGGVPHAFSNAPQRTTVPRAKVEELAAAVREMLALKDRQAATQAQLIRWCLYAFKQTTAQAQRTLERERRHLKGPKSIVRMHEPQKKVNDDRRLAMLHLEWLATQLEGPAPAPLDLAAVPDNLRKSVG